MLNLKYTGLDQTTNDYGGVKNKTSRNMNFVEGDNLNTPFDSGTFELVFSLDMIEHIRMQAIGECVSLSTKYTIIALLLLLSYIECLGYCWINYYININ